MFDKCMKQPKPDALAMVEKLGVKLTSEDKDLHEKQLLKVLCTFQLFLWVIEMFDGLVSVMCYLTQVVKFTTV